MSAAGTPAPLAPPSPEAVIISSMGGGPSIRETVAICVMAVSIAFVAYKMLVPLARAFAARIEGRGGNPALEQRVNGCRRNSPMPTCCTAESPNSRNASTSPSGC